MKKISLVLLVALVLFGVGVGAIMCCALHSARLSNEIAVHLLRQEIEHLLRRKQPASADPAAWAPEIAGEIADLDLGHKVTISDVRIWNQDLPANLPPPAAGNQNGVGTGFSAAGLRRGIFSRLEQIGSWVGGGKTMALLVPVRFDRSEEAGLVVHLRAGMDNLPPAQPWRNLNVWLAVLSGCLLLYVLLHGLYRVAFRQIERQDKKLRLAEDRFSKVKQEWEEIFDTINDAITIHDQNFTIIRANRAAGEMLGLSAGGLVGQKCFRSYHGQNAPPALCPSCETLRTGVASITEVFEPFLDKHIEVKALPRFDAQHHLIGLVHVVRDITARKQAEEKQQKLQVQLTQVQKMESVGRLAGGIAHDFNNILSVIIGYSELLQRALPGDSELVRDKIVPIREAAEKASSLTRQLLAFSRKQVLDMRPVDLNRVVEELGRMLRRVIGEDIILELHLSSRIGTVIADSGQIEQVLLNLAVNARDAMPDGGHFILETQMVDIGKEYIDHHAEARLGPHVLLAVTDTGTGMPPQVREHIFEPFFTTKETGKGTGLGLATVYGIVKQHGGQIYVYSELGKGTTFKIYLPSTPHVEAEAVLPSSQGLPTGTETLLIAEDDPTIRSMFRACLEPLGYTILLAADGREAMALSARHAAPIHLLLTDVIMPNMNGQELADALGKTRPEMAVLFMSGYTDDVIAHHGVLGAGINFIQKPITLSLLAHKLREVLHRN